MNNPGNGLIKFTQRALDQIANLDDIIDRTIEPVKDYTDTLADLGIPIRSFLAIATFRQRHMLKSFLKSYATCLLEDYELDQEEVEKLEKYLSKKENLQFISEIIESGLQAKAVKCAAILGVLAGRSIKNKKELNQEDVVLITTLKEVNDIDLENFITLIESFQVYQKSDGWDFEAEFRTLEMYKQGIVWPMLNITKASLELTIEKLKRTGALSYGEGGIGSVGNARGAFMFSLYTEALYSLIKGV